MQLEEPPQRGAGRRASRCGSWASVRSTCWRAAFAALSIALWALQFAGWLGTPYLPGPLWHAHEMLFGFALAVVVGFLFTAGRNWSNRPTPTGAPLAALAALWLAGRVLVLTPFGWAAALANAAFPLAAAIALAIPFVRRGNRRNYFFVGLLVLMSGAASPSTSTSSASLRLPALVGIQVALDVVLFIMAVMGGRVIPMFTNNGVPGAKASRRAGSKSWRWLGAGAAGRRRAAGRGTPLARRWPGRRRWRTLRAGPVAALEDTARADRVGAARRLFLDPGAPGAARGARRSAGWRRRRPPMR